LVMVKVVIEHVQGETKKHRDEDDRLTECFRKLVAS